MCVSYRTEKDKAPPSPLLTIHSNGLVSIQNDQVLVSTCRMHVYKFPFDIQSCNLTFKSVVHSGELIIWNWRFSSREQTPPVTGPPLFIETSQLLFFFISPFSRWNTAYSQCPLFRGHTHNDANPVWVAVHRHDRHQQNCQHVWPKARRADLHCEWYWIQNRVWSWNGGYFFSLLYIKWSCKNKQRKNSSNENVFLLSGSKLNPTPNCVLIHRTGWALSTIQNFHKKCWHLTVETCQTLTSNFPLFYE